eukprot:2784078-Rhodomonas_salina.1
MQQRVGDSDAQSKPWSEKLSPISSSRGLYLRREASARLRRVASSGKPDSDSESKPENTAAMTRASFVDRGSGPA